MRPLLLLCAIPLFLSTGPAPAAPPAQDVLWVRQIGTPGEDSTGGIAHDADGSVYATGPFSGVVDLDPEAGVTELTPLGTQDVYVTRFDRDGRLVWARQLGGAGARIGPGFLNGIATDGGHSLYIAGTFSGTVDFDPGPGVFTMTPPGAASDLFVVKLTQDGDFLWARQMSCSSGGAGVQAMAADPTGVHFTGIITGTCDFDPGSGTATVDGNTGQEDFYIAGLDSAGNFAFAGGYGSSGSDISFGMTSDRSGNVYTVGRARGSLDYDTGPGTDIQNGPFFVIKQAPDGTEQWARVAQGLGLGRAFGVDVDPAGAVYVAGHFSDTIDFDPGPGSATRATGSISNNDAFLYKLDANGVFAWVYTYASTAFTAEVANAIAVQPDGTVHVGGTYAGPVDFDPGAASFTLTPAGSSDVVIVTLDGTTGGFLGALSLGGTLRDSLATLLVDPGGNLLAAGTFNGSADFDPGAGSHTLTSAGGADLFFWKYGRSELHLHGDQGNPASIAFSPGSPTSFDLVKGLLSDLRTSGDYSAAACFGWFTSTPVADAETPPVNDGFYYLARGVDCCAAEGYGDSTLVPDPRDALDAGGVCP
jgi:hypothetical protein